LDTATGQRGAKMNFGFDNQIEMQKNMWKLLGFPLALLTLTVNANCIRADEAPVFYKGKTVTIAIGAPPGGSFDGYARLLARHLGKHLEGNPLIIVKNINGAAGAAAAANVAHVAPKDGTYIAAVQGSTLLDPLIKEGDSSNFDPTGLTYLGSAAKADYVCLVRSDAPATTLEGMFKTQVVIGGASASGFLGYVPVMLNNVLGTKFKVVLGYPGSREIILAIQKREVDGMCSIPWASLKLQYPNLLRDQDIKIFVQENDVGAKELNDNGIPLIGAYVKDEEQRRILSIVNSQQTFAFPYFVAAEVPMDRVQMLRRAFLAAWRDPELLDDAKKLQLDVDPIPGEEIQSLLRSIYASPPALLKSVKKAVTPN
jgi:tripartite-type tricarboxylate transporter receptor subunit TctC